MIICNLECISCYTWWLGPPDQLEKMIKHIVQLKLGNTTRLLKNLTTTHTWFLGYLFSVAKNMSFLLLVDSGLPTAATRTCWMMGGG